MTDHEPGETPLSELEEQARITPADIERAKRRWREVAEPDFADLLDAEQRPKSP